MARAVGPNTTAPVRYDATRIMLNVTSMTFSHRAITLAQQWEGLQLSAYRDSVGVPTIGWGHTRGVEMHHAITEAQAFNYLQLDLAHAALVLNHALRCTLSQDEFDALTDLTFNVGEASLLKGTIPTLLNAGAREQAYAKLLQYNHAGGRVIAGLTRRRYAEYLLAMKGETPPV